MNKKQIFWCVFSWLFVAVVVAFIVYFALQDGEASTKTSTGVVDVIIDAIPNGDEITEEQKVGIHISIRQLAHFGIYFLLGFSLASALKCSFKNDNNIYILLALAFSVQFSMFDEFFMQQNTSGRGAELKDVITDSSGIVLGIFFFSLLFVLLKFISNKIKRKSLK